MKAVERQHGVCKFSVVWWLGSRVSKAHCAEKFDYMSPEALLSPFTAEGDCNRLLHLSLQSVQSETDEHALPPSRVCTQEENVSSKNYLVMEKWSFKKRKEKRKRNMGHVYTFHFMFQHDYQIGIFLYHIRKNNWAISSKNVSHSHLIGDVFFVYSRAFLSMKCLLCQWKPFPMFTASISFPVWLFPFAQLISLSHVFFLRFK